MLLTSRFIGLAGAGLIVLVACETPVDPPGRVTVQISPASAVQGAEIVVSLRNGSDRNITIDGCGRPTQWERRVGDAWEQTELGVMPFCNDLTSLRIPPDDDHTVALTVPAELTPGEYRLVWTAYSSFAPGDGNFNVMSNTFVVSGTP